MSALDPIPWLFKKSSALWVFVFILPLATLFGQETVPPNLSGASPSVIDGPGEVANESEITPDDSEEPPTKDEDSAVRDEKNLPNFDQRTLNAGGAQTTSLSFQIPTQPQATVDQSTGALVYAYRIELPEGRNGLTPELSL